MNSEHKAPMNVWMDINGKCYNSPERVRYELSVVNSKSDRSSYLVIRSGDYA